MSSISPIARRLSGVTLAAATAVVLTACDSDQIGAAAVVGGDRITVEELQDQAQTLIDVPGSGFAENPDRTQLQQDLLSQTILTKVMDRVAADEGVEVTAAQVDDCVQEQMAGVPEDEDLDALLAQSMFTEDTFRDACRNQLVADAVTGDSGDQAVLMDALNAAAEELNIEVNPRYGEWGENLSVDPVSGSISVATDEGEGEAAGEDPETVPAP